MSLIIRAWTYIEMAETNPELLPYIRSDKVIYLTRQDKVAQAVSYARAIQSGIWYGQQSGRQVDYDYQLILRSFRQAWDQELQWRQIFAATGAIPLEVHYEDLLERESDVISSLSAELGVDIFGIDHLDYVPEISPQSDSVNHDWVRRFQDDYTNHTASLGYGEKMSRILKSTDVGLFSL